MVDLNTAAVVAVLLALPGCGGGGGGAPSPDATVDATVFRDAGVWMDAAVPPAPECLTSQDRGTPCTVTIVAKVIQFETAADPPTPVELRYNTAWDVEQVFPVSCPALAMNTVGGAGFMTTFDRVTCSSRAPFITALFADDAPGAAPERWVQSLNDRRLPDTCATGCALGTTAAPFRVFVLEKSSFDGWKQAPGLSSVDWTKNGIVIITYVDKDGLPLANVRPSLRDPVLGTSRFLTPGSEVFFLGTDRKQLVGGTVTSASGSVVVPMVAGRARYLSGTGGGVTFSPVTGVATAADSVFFEEISAL